MPPPSPSRSPQPPRTCAEHPRAPAGWQCLDCGRALCPDCVAEELVERGTSFLSCSACDGRVEPLMEPGSRERVRDHLWQVMRVPVSWPTALLGPLTVWALVKTRELGPGGMAAALLFAVAPCFWALYFVIARSGARAFDRLDRGEALDLMDHVIVPGARAWGVTALAADPVSAIRWFGSDAAAPISNPLLWALVALGALVMPLWTAYLAGGARLLEAISPSRALRSIRDLGGDYWTVAGWTLAVASLSFFWAGRADAGIRGPWVLLLQGLAVYAMLLVARFTGGLLAVRGPELGFALRPDQLRPVLPDAVPRGSRRAKPPPPPPKVIEPIELDVEPPAGPLVLERGMSGGPGRAGPGEE